MCAAGLAVGLDPEGYGNPDFCWISMYDKLMWSFAGPVSVVILVLCSSVCLCVLFVPYKGSRLFISLSVCFGCMWYSNDGLNWQLSVLQMNGGMFLMVLRMTCNPTQKEIKKLPVM